VKKEGWLFLTKLLFFTLAFGFLWFRFLQDWYPHLLKPVAFPFFQWVGVRKWRLSILLDHYTNIIPFVALVFASPGFFKQWKRTILALVAGLVVMAIGHLLLSWIDYHYWAEYKTTRSFFRRAFHFYLLNDALPLGLWLIFYPRVLPRVFAFLKFGSKTENAHPPDPPPAPDDKM